MHFLITNDDGIQAPGLKTLAEAAIGAGHRVTIAAPASEQSATSHRLTLNAPMLAYEYPFPGAAAYAINGTPVDCVRIGLGIAEAPVDFCLSGINDGVNVGTAIIYSGTAAAAREAAMMYVPSLAVSLGYGNTQEMRTHLAKMALRLAGYLVSHPMPRLTFGNLNAPAVAPRELKPLRLAAISDSFYRNGYVKRVSPRGAAYFWIDDNTNLEPPAPGTDLALLDQGYSTLTFVGGFQNNNAAFPGLPEALEG